MNTITVYKADGGDHLPDDYTATIAGERMHFFSLEELKAYVAHSWPTLLFDYKVIWVQKKLLSQYCFWSLDGSSWDQHMKLRIYWSVSANGLSDW